MSEGEATITKNGEAVNAASLGTAVPTDPGDYVIEAKRDGAKPWSSTVTIAARDAKTVTVPALSDGGATDPTPNGDDGAGEGGGVRHAGDRRRRAHRRGRRDGASSAAWWAAWCSAAPATRATIPRCARTTAARTRGARRSTPSETQALVSNILVFGGIGVGAAGAVLMVLGLLDDDEQVAVIPTASPDGAGMDAATELLSPSTRRRTSALVPRWARTFAGLGLARPLQWSRAFTKTNPAEP